MGARTAVARLTPISREQTGPLKGKPNEAICDVGEELMDTFDIETTEQAIQEIDDLRVSDVASAVEHDYNNIVLVPAGDNTPRWSPGERLHHLFEQRCDATCRSSC